MSGLLRMSDAYALAIHAMAYLAACESGRSASVADMASALKVSETHLAKVLQRLARLGFVKSRRGVGGGFGLARPAGRITLLEIYEALDGPLSSTTCLLGREVCDAGACVMKQLLASVHDEVRRHLAGTKLSDLQVTPPGKS